MPRHESVTDEYVADLNAKLQEAFDRVSKAPNWPETQKRMVTGSYAYLVAIDRVDYGWSREEIESELSARTVFGKMPNAIKVIGNRRVDEDT
jgi:hypothetical protein